MLRLAACLGVGIEIIEPCGFALGDRQLKRAAMDYGGAVEVRRHADWNAFAHAAGAAGQRIVLMSSKAQASLYDTQFGNGDIMLMGSESAGVPADVAAACDIAIRIPMQDGMRCLNVAVAAGVALGEALRQTRFA